MRKLPDKRTGNRISIYVQQLSHPDYKHSNIYFLHTFEIEKTDNRSRVVAHNSQAQKADIRSLFMCLHIASNCHTSGSEASLAICRHKSSRLSAAKMNYVLHAHANGAQTQLHPGDSALALKTPRTYSPDRASIITQSHVYSTPRCPSWRSREGLE
ncbi:hypothetical protein BDZ45DRAFT_411846 [Acephala macrosclerotiorum]|nr:hypothetical protein BDZ45DRAFT_411846 [Acephala macrosclerotiorum]